MNCPNCEAELSNTNQKYCEFCGHELINSNILPDENVKTNSNPTRSRRRCC